MTDAELDALVALGEGITPGPWLVDADDFYSIIAYPEGVATCVADTDPPHLRTVADDGEAMANARAIAAAPDLIAALTTLRKQRDELREALLPFAELAGDVSMNDPLRKWLTVAHLVDARQALSNMEEPRHDT